MAAQDGSDYCRVQKSHKNYPAPSFKRYGRGLEDMHVFQQTVYTYEDDSTHRLLKNEESRGSVEEWELKPLEHVTTHFQTMRREDGLDVATLNSCWLLQTVARDTTKKNTPTKKKQVVQSSARWGHVLRIVNFFISDIRYTCYAVNSGDKIFHLVRYNPVRYVGVRMY